MSFTRTLFAAVSAAALSPAFAGDATDLEPVVITATRTETPLADLPVPVVVIDRNTIERNAGATLPDLLRLVAGVEIAQSGGPGQLATAFIRGTESDHVLVLIDGVELSPGSIGTPRLQDIDPAIVERIEIVKGPRSALHGSDAVGGVINIITRRDADRVRAHAGAGSFNTQELGAGTGMRFGAGGFDIDISRRESDGFPSLEGSDIDRGYENTTVNLRLNATLGPVGTTLRHYRSEGTSEYLDFLLAPVSQDFENHVTELGFDWQLDAWRSQLSISEAQDRLAQNDSTTFADTDRRVVDWQNDFLAGAHTLTAGAYLETENVIAENFGRTEAETDVRALYLQEHWRSDAFDLLLAARSTDHERFGNEPSWNVDAGWQLTDVWSFRANIGRAFRAPNATFLYGPFGANPNLQPEISLNSELGFHWRATERQQVTLAAFRNRIDDMIDFDPIASSYRNIEEVEIRGVELGHEWQAANWRGHASVTLQEPENVQSGEPLLRRAEKSLRAGLSRNFGSIDAGFDVFASGERPDIDAATFQPVTEPGYVLLNLTTQWHISPDWSLAARLENLLDADYQTASGYNTADRSIFVTLRYRH